MSSTLSNLIDIAADSSAHASAFRTPDRNCSFSEVAEKSNQVANFLIELGVKRGDRIGILLSRSVDSAIAVYGTLKSGAAYVPIDPKLPVERLQSVIEDCGIQKIFCPSELQTKHSDLIATKSGIDCVLGINPADSVAVSSYSWEQIFQCVKSKPNLDCRPTDLAYIIYTSGSTGRPKGIMHTHSSGLAYARLARETYDLQPSDCIGSHSPLHFDMSKLGYFAGPLAGASVVIVPAAYTTFPASLSKLIETERISVWYSVPFALTQLLMYGCLEKRCLSNLRWVIFAGETFPSKQLRHLMHQIPHARFSNAYGPAETNVCTSYHVPQQFDPIRETLPIGRVLPETVAMVVNGDIPVRVGEPGELLVHSSTMMQGYWNRPELNERVFLLQYDSQQNLKKYYRTGDLVRLHEDGNYRFLGRVDRQIKLRGNRIELDEIEEILVSQPSVAGAAVFAVKTQDESAMLMAHVLLNSQSPDSESKLLQLLKRKLPAYAIPTIRLVDELPRTSTGKIDRLKLQRLEERKSVEHTSAHQE